MRMVLCSSDDGRMRDGYSTGGRSRLWGMVAGVGLHMVLVALLLWHGGGFSGAPGDGGGGGSGPAVFDLRLAETGVAPPRKGGGGDRRAVMPPVARTDDEAGTGGPGAGRRREPGAVDMGKELADLLSDDPAVGGGRADYERILRRHIAAHSHSPSSRGRRYTGTVMLRFRVSRDGQIIDARVLRSRGASLDEAALATLWRSEPLPAVPGFLDAPLEVDVPIDFLMRG